MIFCNKGEAVPDKTPDKDVRPRPDSSLTFAIRLMQDLVVPTFVLSPDRRVIIWNKACERLTGVSADEVIGTSEHWRGFYDEPRYCLADTLVLGQARDFSSLYSSHTPMSDDAPGWRAENWCTMPRAGRQCYLAIDAGPIFDESGELIAVVETLRDMTLQKEAQMALQRLAARDGLTGIANRRCFDEALAAEWHRAQRDQTSLALLLIDVDHFKRYNDTYGHQKGDDCLKNIARAMEDKIFRPADLLARYGGEEFVILMPNTDTTGAQMVANRIVHHVHEQAIPHEASDIGQRVSISVGVAATVPGQHLEADRLLAAADKALYAAKHSGRNRVSHNEVTLPAA
jgi:diguanylate cyclase (GGDEF)-like protein